MLPSLSGLDQISNSSMTGFSIYDNASLSECEVVSICAYLASPGSNIFISNNAAGCNSVEELEQACLTLSDGKENAGSAVVSVFPNPAEGRITVEILKDTRPVSYSMIDFSGRMVREGMLTSPRTEIDLSDIPAGVYILKADSEHSAKVLKVIRN
jgi:hypothetical protein